TGGRDADKQPDPIIVTPAADHWVGGGNYAGGRGVVDLASTKRLATAWIGVALLRGVGQCPGWAGKEVGFGGNSAPPADSGGLGELSDGARRMGPDAAALLHRSRQLQHRPEHDLLAVLDRGR